MTEAEWLKSNDPDGMYYAMPQQHRSSQRRIDLFCLACVRLLWHLIEDEGAKGAFAWLEEHAGERTRSSGRHSRDLFAGAGRALYEAHHRRTGDLSGRAIHIAYDFWANWYEYAFDNLPALVRDYPGSLREDHCVYLPAIIRDIFGNPFRPVTLDSTWRTSTAVALAQQMYESRDFSPMPILADALQDAGCDHPDILSHCRGDGVHVRGCWVVDLVLAKQ